MSPVRRVALFVLLSILPGLVFAQSIKERDLARMRKSTQSTEFNLRQLMIRGGSIKGLVSLDSFTPPTFTHVIHRGNVTNQRRSGRCWLFAGLNVLRIDTAKALGVEEFEYSENYLFFFHKLELANSMLVEGSRGQLAPEDAESAFLLRNGLGDGGYWGMFSSLVEKYGAVPVDIMPETFHSSNTGELNMLLDMLVKKHLAKIWELRRAKRSGTAIRLYRESAMVEVYSLLAMFLGTPPENFSWGYVGADGKARPDLSYTPHSFYQTYAKEAVVNKVNVMSDPSMPYYMAYSMPKLKNVLESRGEVFVNVPPRVALGAAMGSIVAGHPVWFGVDVGKYSNLRQGVMDLKLFDFESILGISLQFPRSDMLKTYATSATHAMVLVGVNINERGVADRWLVENSWGPEAGMGGYMSMTSDWFNKYGFDVVVDSKYLPKDAVKALKRRPVKLPAWHHLWRPNNVLPLAH